MTEPIYRIIYRSRPTQVVVFNLVEEVENIIATSVCRNYSVGVTGILLLAKGFFFQAIEGVANEVRSTYARIALDRRHCDPHVLSQGFVEHRLFGEWAMCAGHLTPTDGLIVNSLWSHSEFYPEKLSAERAEQLLVAVADFQRRAVPEVLI